MSILEQIFYFEGKISKNVILNVLVSVFKYETKLLTVLSKKDWITVKNILLRFSEIETHVL